METYRHEPGEQHVLFAPVRGLRGLTQYPERRLVWSFEIVWSGAKKTYRVYTYFPLLGNGRAQGQELMKALVQLYITSNQCI
jgi:hypothetical protein